MSAIQENIEYRVVYAVIFRATKPGRMIDGWDVRAISLQTGEVHHVGRGSNYWEQLYADPNRSQIRHLWSKGSFTEVLDIVNPWDYPLTGEGLNAFIINHTFIPVEEAFEDIYEHPQMLEEYRTKQVVSTA